MMAQDKNIPDRTVWLSNENREIVKIIDQRTLPFQLVIEDLKTVSDVARAIRDMHIRGAGCIGATAGYGMYIAALEARNVQKDEQHNFMKQSGQKLMATRPTAVNLSWAVNRQLRAICDITDANVRVTVACNMAEQIANEDVEWCRQIGEHGVHIIENIYNNTHKTVNILTHCNAGWLAFVKYGSATAPIYAAHRKGIPVHVWVDETRPRNQGARLTAWELSQFGVPHKIISDNAGGHLMQHGMVDMVIVGSDRTTYTGDVANKIGTYLKALAAYDNQVPFYVALPSSTFDWDIQSGLKDIPIEERGSHEIREIRGKTEEGNLQTVKIMSDHSPVANYAFDVTPSRLVTGLITERGVCRASKDAILKLFPDKAKKSHL